ncbi:hypothetical protein MHM93_07840 [Pseudoalteromonas sp. MM17-2]|uniref:hypothetical protein n=1 Tax=Pseudoalteromonas sp. MM17-2 TaxID=2917753 RepID=UPI001EF3ECAA|nr:hypothetical protein [Pseudoalteromonas sp. MM17-2]MCG7544091.1 hypothetical protein [Pseudoalteromonas sp. MM17-2]
MSLSNPININALLAASFASLEQGQTTKKDALSAELANIDTAIQALIAQKAAENGGDIVAARDAVLAGIGDLQIAMSEQQTQIDASLSSVPSAYKASLQQTISTSGAVNTLFARPTSATEIVLLSRTGRGMIHQLRTTFAAVFRLTLDGVVVLDKTGSQNSNIEGSVIGGAEGLPPLEYSQSIELVAAMGANVTNAVAEVSGNHFILE